MRVAKVQSGIGASGRRHARGSPRGVPALDGTGRHEPQAPQHLGRPPGRLAVRADEDHLALEAAELRGREGQRSQIRMYDALREPLPRGPDVDQDGVAARTDWKAALALIRVEVATLKGASR